MESFLKEQLKRIQELTDRMSSLHDNATQLSKEMERDRERIEHDPLSDVRDFRTYQSADSSNKAESDDRRTPPPSRRKRRER
jgi:hypothetical protein